MPGNVIELSDLTKKYGAFTAVDHLNLKIRKGEIFGLLGPNGAGKSTVILMMLGLTEPTGGSISIRGIDPTVYPLEVKRTIGYLPEDVGFYDELTGLENLVYTARLNHLPAREAEKKAQQLLVRVGLSKDAGKKTGKYSRGMRQRLGLADVLIKSPEIIILDEPTLGIDPTGVKELLELITGLSREEGLTVLLSSHDLHNVQKMCDRVGLFVNGRLLAEGDIQTLSKKLFNNVPILIAAGLATAYQDAKTEIKIQQVHIRIQEMDDVQSVSLNNGLFQIECTQDITPEIARIIVQSGLSLNYLNKKEFDLDDIYYRYFEGEQHYERKK